MMKMKFRRAFLERKKERLKRRNRLRGIHLAKLSKSTLLLTTKSGPQARLDHRNYGVWYMKPTEWESRFHRKSTKAAREQCIHKREPRDIEKVTKVKKEDSKIEEKFKKSDTEVKLVHEQIKDQKEEVSELKETEIDDEEISQVDSKNYINIFFTMKCILIFKITILIGCIFFDYYFDSCIQLGHLVHSLQSGRTTNHQIS